MNKFDKDVKMWENKQYKKENERKIKKFKEN